MYKVYDEEILKQINENVDLIAYANKSMELYKRGNEYFAHCPKHTDDTPSLSFTPRKNLYYCFSCGCSGGIIDFLMDFENLTFREAVEKSAKLAKIDLTKMCRSDTVMFLKRVKKLHEPPKEPYKHEILKDDEYTKYKKEAATEWVKEGISREVMDLFEVRIDTYQNRIVYPVYDIKGNLINIKGRTRYPNYKALKIPKYINYHSVGVMDYFQGLNITLPYVQEKKEIIIFESIKSVMKAYDWGYKNCASAEKHTLTKEQFNLLVRLKVNIVFAYDSDVDYNSSDVKQSIDRLKRLTNVYLIQDKKGLLGGKQAKNAPVDLGKDIWETLYGNKRKIT